MGTNIRTELPAPSPADRQQEGHATASQSEEKRRQILIGAREVFMASGFDGASMGNIARTAGVSKGTLYVYFGSKEDLFAALVSEECSQTAELCFILDPKADVRETLTQIGYRYVEAMIRPEHIATVRMVVGVAEKFPAIGQAFLSASQETGVRLLSEWLRAKNARGELFIEDVELASWQFIVGCHALIVMPMMFTGAPRPTDALIERVVTHTVNSFMSSFARRRRKDDPNAS